MPELVAACCVAAILRDCSGAGPSGRSRRLRYGMQVVGAFGQVTRVPTRKDFACVGRPARGFYKQVHAPSFSAAESCSPRSSRSLPTEAEQMVVPVVGCGGGGL